MGDFQRVLGVLQQFGAVRVIAKGKGKARKWPMGRFWQRAEKMALWITARVRENADPTKVPPGELPGGIFI